MTTRSPIQLMQQMAFQTAGGELLRQWLYAAGHFGKEIENDQQRIEHNLVKRLMQACGIAMDFKPAVFKDVEQQPNLIDEALEQGDESE